jgi:hypothetical protein
MSGLRNERCDKAARSQLALRSYNFNRVLAVNAVSEKNQMDGARIRNDARSEAERVPIFRTCVSRSVVAARKEKRSWHCADCGFECPDWKGSERFPYCTTCERRRIEAERQRMNLELRREHGEK